MRRRVSSLISPAAACANSSSVRHSACRGVPLAVCRCNIAFSSSSVSLILRTLCLAYEALYEDPLIHDRQDSALSARSIHLDQPLLRSSFLSNRGRPPNDDSRQVPRALARSCQSTRFAPLSPPGTRPDRPPGNRAGGLVHRRLQRNPVVPPVAPSPFESR